MIRGLFTLRYSHFQIVKIIKENFCKLSVIFMVTLCVVAVAQRSSRMGHLAQFTAWMATHGKTYPTVAAFRQAYEAYP